MSYPTTSRVHPLRTFGKNVYVKREDELGFGISGYKIRKYSSLIPALLKEKPDEVIVLGTPHSNHVLSICQLLCENGLTPVLFLAGGKQVVNGNWALTSLFVEKENVHFFNRGSWDELEKFAEEYVAKSSKKVMIIPKGANTKDSLKGLLSLTEDILRNEKELGLTFDHIFIDSGTGLTAASLILALSQLNRKTHVHVVHLAGSPDEFYQTLASAKSAFEPVTLLPYSVHLPQNAKSFGSTNAKVFQTIRDMAKNEGFFVDPVYTAKLFDEGRQILTSQNLTGNILFIHSGGALTLCGFLDQLTKISF